MLDLCYIRYQILSFETPCHDLYVLIYFYFSKFSILLLFDIHAKIKLILSW